VRVIANKSLCSGHARCASVAPEFFDLTDEGYIAFDEKAVSSDQEAGARRGVRACPERALTFVESSAAPAAASTSTGD
jgi:ferredoxin